MDLTPRRHDPGDPALPDILRLIQDAFSGMTGRIDPPSSMHALTAQSLSEQAAKGEIWSLGNPVKACVILTPKPHALYIGKLSVAQEARRQGLARRLITHAENRAAALHIPTLTLQARVELTENHRFFETCGFCETGRTAHPGFDRATSITYEKRVSEDAS